MAKSEQKQKYAAPWQIVLMVIGFVVMTPIYVITVFLLVSIYIIYPITSSIDRAKFERVDNLSRSVYDQLVAKSGGAEKWAYSKSCEDTAANFIGYGDYICTLKAYAQTDVSSASSVKELNDKYMVVVDNSDSLKLKDSTTFSPATFGIKFQVSSLINRYELKAEDNIMCTFKVQLDQPDGDNTNTQYGEDVVGKTGQVNISFSCEGKAISDWYR